MEQTAPANPLDAPARFETYYGRIFRYVQHMVRDSVEAEDLTQETFLRATVSATHCAILVRRSVGSIELQRTVCLDKLRQRASRAPRESESDVNEMDLPDPEAPSFTKNDRARGNERMRATIHRKSAR